MTCIVAIKTNEGVYFGCDTMVTCGHVKFSCETKVFQNSHFIIGVAGSARLSQILQYNYKPSIIKKKQPIDNYIYEKMIPDLIKILETSKFLGFDNGCASFGGSSILFSLKNEIYSMDSMFSTLKCLDSFYAIGSGNEVALGVLKATEDLTPEIRIKKAIIAAGEISVGCDSNFKIIFKPK